LSAGPLKGYSTLQATKSIISDRIDNPNDPKKSVWSLQKGISGHLIKETTRIQSDLLE